MHGKHYETSAEYDQRLKIFAENAEMVSKHNRENHSYTSMSSCPSNYSKDHIHPMQRVAGILICILASV